MLKKLILATVGLVIAAPALADNGHRGYRYDYRPPVGYRPVVVQPYYRPAPRPVYVVHRAPPPPIYVQHSHPDAGAAILFGALLGAVVAHQIATR